MRTDGTGGTVIVGIGVENTGAIAAGETVVTVVFPEHGNVRWSGPEGEQIAGGEVSAATEDETLEVQSGATVSCRYLSSKWERIGRRSHYAKHVAIYFRQIPDSGEVWVPLRVATEAEELPDEEPQYVVEHRVRVSH